MRTSRVAVLVIMAVVLVGFAGCKGKKKAGDKCAGDEALCLDKNTILECQDSKLASMSCKGPKGCNEKHTGTTHSARTTTHNYTVECDFSTAAAGDGCLDDDSRCSPDKKLMVSC